MLRHCEVCTKDVSRSPSRNAAKRVFCSNVCKFAYYTAMHVPCLCPECGKSFTRMKEQLEKYSNSFCSLRCSATYNLTKRGGTISPSRRTGLSPFMYILRCIKSRAKYRNRKIEFCLTPIYIRDLFEAQNKRCPYTGHTLIVPYSGDRSTIT